MKYLGRIDSVENFKNYCEDIKFLMEKDLYYHKKRIMLDWVNEDFYGCYGRLEELVNKFGGCDKSLLFFSKKGGEVRLHRDNKDFGKTAYSLSSIDFEFIHHGKKYDCKAGEIYTFNSKLIHGIERIKSDRWSLVWWK